MKRLEYDSWNQLFMNIAESASKRSKDPRTQNGACIINPVTKRVVSVGYNGLPKGLDDDGEFNGTSYWDRDLKNSLVLHAEENAILNAAGDLNKNHLYLYSEKGYYPCSRCCGMLSQVGIVRVILKWATTENTPTYNWDLSKHILLKSKIDVVIINEKI